MQPPRLFDIPPSRDLAPFVLAYDLVEVSAPDFTIPGTALPAHALVFHYGDSTHVTLGARRLAMPAVSVRGVVDTPWSVTGEGRLQLFFARLRPPTLYHLTRESVTGLTSQVADAAAFGLRPSPDWVVDALAEAPPDPGAKVAIVERYLRVLLRALPLDGPSVVRACVHDLNGLARLRADERRGERQLRRDFARYVGVPPLRYRDILRIDAACKQLARPRSGTLTRVALDLGFYDLAHFDRAFRRYAGMSPTEFVHCVGTGPVGTFGVEP